MTTTELLEQRYRRLLGWYPADYRAAYAEEMIGVLMTASAPDQRRPDLREAASLMASGLRKRLGSTASGVSDPAWRAAAGVFGVAVPILLVALYSHPLMLVLAWRARVDEAVYLPGTTLSLVIGVSVGWSIVAVAVMLRWPVVAALVAAAVAIVIIVDALAGDRDNPSSMVSSWWQLILVGATAMAVIMLLAGPKSTSRPLGWRPATAVISAAIAILVAPVLEALGWTVQRGGDSFVIRPRGGFFLTPWSNYLGTGSGSAGIITVVLHVAAAVAVLTVFIRLAAPIRRRVALLCVPVLATIVLVREAFGGFLSSSSRFDPPVRLVGAQWTGLILVPTLAFVLGLIVLNRYERMLRMIAAGRAIG
jgi:hypothetical protein